MCVLFANKTPHVVEATKKKIHCGESFMTIIVAKMQRSALLVTNPKAYLA